MIGSLLAWGAPLLAVLPLPPAPAAEWTLPTIEVVAERFGDRTGPLPLASTVLDRAAIARRPDADLAALLRPVAGLRVVSRGADALGASVSIRGSTTEQVLVLVDGRRWNSAQGGGVDLASISLDSIERIEVLRGGASAAWGADAIGGAIHVTTRGAAAVRPRLRVAAGSAGSTELAARGGLELGAGWNARAGASFENTLGDVEVPGAEIDRIENGDVQRAAADACVDGRLSDAFAARLDGSLLRMRRGVPGSEEFPTPSARLEDDRETWGLRVEGDGARFAPSLDVSMIAMHRLYQEPEASLGAIDESHDDRRFEGEIGAAWRNDRTSLRAFAGAAHERLVSTTDGERTRPSAHARVHAVHDGVWMDRTIRTLVSARVDAIDGFEPFLSPRAGLQLDVVPSRLTTRASAGLSFRPPAFDDLFWPARATMAGNPDLRAERAADADLGLAWNAPEERAHLAMEAFVRRVDDLIQWAPGAGGIWRPVNIGRASLAGIETEGEARAGAPFGTTAVVSGALARTWTRDESGEPNADGNELVYRPRWIGSATLGLVRSGAEVEAAVRVTGDSWATRANTRVQPGYTMLDLRTRFRATSTLALDAAITNLLDHPARDLRDFPLPGRGFEIGITWEGRGR